MELFPQYHYIVSFTFILAGNAGNVQQNIRVVDKESLAEMIELVNTVATTLADRRTSSIPRLSIGRFGKTDTVVHLQNVAGITFTIHPLDGEAGKPIRGLTQTK